MSDGLTLPDIKAEDAAPARILYVELKTRITTQPLHYRSGDEEAALASVHNLFATTRELLRKHPLAAAFEMAGFFLLNRLLRSYTARWHRWLVDKRFTDELSRRQFRYELKQLQPRLLEFADLLNLLVLGPTATKSAQELYGKIVGQAPGPDRTAQLGGAVLAGIGSEVQFRIGPLHTNLGPPGRDGARVAGPTSPSPQGIGADSATPHQSPVQEKFATADEINTAERRFIHRRRQASNLEPQSEGVEPVENATGLCLSGGGIRSATFCLGIVQVLARQQMLQRFDYLSTVSGGGYLGSFLTSFLGTPPGGPSENNSPAFTKSGIHDATEAAFAAQNGPESAAVRHLRNNSRYLLSGGLWGRLKIFGLLVTGILTNILLVLPFPFLAALAVYWLQRLGYWEPCWPNHPPFIGRSLASLLFLVVVYFLVILWLGLPITRNLARGRPPGCGRVKSRNAWEALAIGVFLVASLAGILLLLPSLFVGIGTFADNLDLLWPALRERLSPTIVTAILSAAPVILGLLTARLKSGLRKRAAAVLFALSGPLLYLVVFFIAGTRLFNAEWPWLVVLVPSAAVTFWGWFCVDVNEFSPHRYYRAKLCECYLAVRGPDQTGVLRNAKEWILHGSTRSAKADETGVGTRRQLPLSKVNQTGAAPYHIINCAANLPASHEPNLRGRDCDFYSFSQAYCGGPVCGYIKTETLERLDPHVDAGTAMAISGAAAGSNMGVKTQKQYRFLLSLLNVRLGYWLRNPLKGALKAWNGPGPVYLFREMSGWMHANSGYLNLSDGGHIENLALYELLRRRCKFIVIVDGGMEPGMECADLMLAQRYAQIDLGVQFNLDIADLALDPNRRSRAYAVFGKVRYHIRPGQEVGDVGWLVYIKLACTGGEPGYVVDYRRQNPDFPHQTTADQMYDEGQFEAYRRLGECAAESLFRSELAGTPVDPQTESAAPATAFPTLRDWFQALANNLLPDNDSAFK